MGALEIGIASVAAIVGLIYVGVYVPIALAAVSFISIWLMRDNFTLAMNLLKVAVSDTVLEYTFATIPLFTFMGLVVSKAGLGTDVYQVMNHAFHRVKGGIGMATVGANAVFAAVTGSSIASASVFTRVSVPEMLRYSYNPRFAVGVVAGSSVLGMIIPPSAMLIIYSFVAEQSIGQMFLAGIFPGLVLSVAYIAAIFAMGRLTPRFVGGVTGGGDHPPLTRAAIVAKMAPIVILIAVVLGGIYTGWLSPVEAGAAGATVAIVIAIVRRRLTLSSFWETLVDTGHISANILFLITAASMYSRMLGMAALPNELGAFLEAYQLSFVGLMVTYVILMLFLGTLIDTASIILIVVPLFLPIIEAAGLSPVWFGIVTVIGAEIGLLTPPLGISCFVIKSTLANPAISLKDVFLGALPFAVVMLMVLVLIIAFPTISIGILG
jgi:tripartite ATP-independent transporter DctM subunit